MTKKPNNNDILNEQGFILGDDEDCPKTARKIKAKQSKFTEKIDVKKLKNTEPVKVDVQQTVKENITTIQSGDINEPPALTINAEKNQPGAEEICTENYTEQEIMFTSYIVQNKSNTDSLLLAYPEYKGQSLDYLQQRSSDLKMSPRIQRLLVRMREKAVRETERNLLWSFEDSVNALKSLVLTAQEEMKECKNDGQIKKQLNMPRVMAIRDAVKEINLMMGYTDKTTKINNTVVIKGSESDLPD